MNETKAFTVNVPPLAHKALRLIAAEQEICIAELVRRSLDATHPGWRGAANKKVACSDVDASEQAQNSRNA